jgi:hypothetical protein
MKKSLHLIGLLGLLSLAAIGSALAQDDAPLVMPGTEPLVAHSAGENTECFVYAKYVVKTAASEDGGSNVSVYKRESPGDACETEGDRWLYVEDADNNSFFGISGKYLFIDMGTSVESRTIDIYDLGQQKSVLSLGGTAATQS